jgi:adenosine deaminase
MITFTTPKTLDNGAIISLAQVKHINLNMTNLNLNGTIEAYFNNEYLILGKPIKSYGVNLNITASQANGDLVAILEAEAIAKNSELANGVQS